MISPILSGQVRGHAKEVKSRGNWWSQVAVASTGMQIAAWLPHAKSRRQVSCHSSHFIIYLLYYHLKIIILRKNAIYFYLLKYEIFGKPFKPGIGIS